VSKFRFYKAYSLKKFKRKLRIKFIKNMQFFKNSVVLYSFAKHPFKRVALEFQWYLYYNAYQSRIRILKFRIFNYRYHYNVAAIRHDYFYTKRRYSLADLNYQFLYQPSILNFLYTYRFFLTFLFIDAYRFLKVIRRLRRGALYYLILTFRKNRLFVNVLNSIKKNFLFVSTGFFIKFFEKRKAFKKGKAVKLLIAKYLRKIFLLSKASNFFLVIKNNPVFLTEMLNFVNIPIIHKFTDPISHKVIEEKNTDACVIKFLYFVFLNNLNFSNNKVKKKGRIKRKIFRKLVLKDNIID